MADNKQDFIDKLRFAGAVSFGAEALCLPADNYFKFAMIESNFNELVSTDSTLKVQLEHDPKYLEAVPALSSMKRIAVTFSDRYPIEVLLYKNKACVDVMRKAVQSLREIPTYLYADHGDRNTLLKKHLIINGFVHTNLFARTVYSPMRIVNIFR